MIIRSASRPQEIAEPAEEPHSQPTASNREPAADELHLGAGPPAEPRSVADVVRALIAGAALPPEWKREQVPTGALAAANQELGRFLRRIDEVIIGRQVLCELDRARLGEDAIALLEAYQTLIPHRPLPALGPGEAIEPQGTRRQTWREVPVWREAPLLDFAHGNLLTSLAVIRGNLKKVSCDPAQLLTRHQRDKDEAHRRLLSDASKQAASCGSAIIQIAESISRYGPTLRFERRVFDATTPGAPRRIPG